jgi:hypothetical protein
VDKVNHENNKYYGNVQFFVYKRVFNVVYNQRIEQNYGSKKNNFLFFFLLFSVSKIACNCCARSPPPVENI